jgi:ATP-dependent Clp protease ATP-binding subunit ClpA
MMAVQQREDVRKAAFAAASAEAQRLGDRRIGTQHLLLALLHNPISLTARTLSVDLDQARSALTELDRAALAAIGIDAAPLDHPVALTPRRRPPFTSGARHVLHRAAEHAQTDRTGKLEERHLLAALLALDAPDAAATLLAQLGIDVTSARRQLDDLP